MDYSVDVEFLCGKSSQKATIPLRTMLIKPAAYEKVKDLQKSIKDAIDNPIGTPPLRELAHGKKSACIVVNDYTRPYPGKEMIAEIVKVLNEEGIPDSAIKLIVASGIHEPQTDEQNRKLYGDDAVNRFEIICHDASDDSAMVNLGRIEYGTEYMDVVINKAFMESELRITTGIIVPHHSAGYSGGRKSVIPGIASIEALKRHHSLPIRPYYPSMGKTDGNAFHELALASARKAGVDFIVNTVSNAHKETVFVVAGDLEKAWRKGCEVCGRLWTIDLPEKADIVIVSPGGYPRDVNLHQAQKALTAAELMCRPGGTIVLCAECQEGFGSNYAQYVKKAKKPQDVIDEYKRDGFNLNANAKAFQLCRALMKFNIVIVGSTFSEEELEQMFLKGYARLQDAVDDLVEKYGKNAFCLACPIAYGLIVQDSEAAM